MQNLRSLFQVAVPFQEVGRRINHNSRHIAFRSGTLRIAPHFSSNSGPNVDTYQRQRRRQSGEKQFQPRHHHRPQGGTNQFKHDKFRNESDNSSVGKLIRLSKRMSELDICSRREADVWIEQGRVLVNGEKAVLGAKIDPDLVNERDIEILTISRQRGEQNHRGNDDDVSFDDQNIHRKQQRMPRHDIDFASIVLHKPVGYVSGQAEHEHIPAIRLLTLERLWKSRPQSKNKKQLDGTNGAEDLDDENSKVYWEGWRKRLDPENLFSWTEGLAPAGRLDCDSSGLLIMTQSGVLAKKIIGQNSSVEKEYVVHVEPAVQMSRIERQQMVQQHRTRSSLLSRSAYDEEEQSKSFKLPKPTHDLDILIKGGAILLGESRPLAPCRARWIEVGKTLHLTLNEGRKHHIRRSCRQLLGYHVTKLHRIRIGPITLSSEGDNRLSTRENLPEGRWRPLTTSEIDKILRS